MVFNGMGLWCLVRQQTMVLPARARPLWAGTHVERERLKGVGLDGVDGQGVVAVDGGEAGRDWGVSGLRAACAGIEMEGEGAVQRRAEMGPHGGRMAHGTA